MLGDISSYRATLQSEGKLSIHFTSHFHLHLIDRMHKWRPEKYSFVVALIRLTNLVIKELFWCILCVLTRLFSLISTKTKECILGAIFAIGLLCILFFWACFWAVNVLQTKQRVHFFVGWLLLLCGRKVKSFFFSSLLFSLIFSSQSSINSSKVGSRVLRIKDWDGKMLK